MLIGEWTTEELEILVQRYREKGIKEGGKFTLAELLLELKRRTPSKFGGLEVVTGIIDLARKSATGLITYGELYNHLSGGLPWRGLATVSEMSRALDLGIHYCVQNSLPILTVIVVRQTGKLTGDAVQGIYDECKELNVDVGISPETFVKRQLAMCQEFINTSGLNGSE